MRPDLKETLNELKKHFELILYTSSRRYYCDAIVSNALETESGEPIFDYRLYKTHMDTKAYRDFSVKNLDLLLEGRSLKDIVIIDNSSIYYRDHLYNGIPIIDFEGDKSDKALLPLKDYLISRILPAEDVREVIKEDFLGSFLKRHLPIMSASQ